MLARCSRLVARRQVQAALQSTETALTANRERFRLEKENGSFLVKGTGKNATFFNESHSVHNFPGSRFVELTRHLSGNPFTGLVLKKLANDFLLLEENDAVGTVIFGTNVECGESFSTGFCEKSLQINRNQTLQGLYTLARLFSTYKKDFVSVSGSKMPGTVLGLNLNAKYRLGVPSLECTVTELTRGYVPAGGLAYHFSRKADAAGLIMARYLAYSLRTIQAVDLYEMGLLTHLVLENPHFMLCDALGHSIGSVSQAYQQLPSHPETLKELLDTMHVCDDEWLEDPMDDPYWDKFMLIKTDRISMEKMKYHKSDIESKY